MNKPTILTGLRANSDLHIGNYFGALLPIVDMAKSSAGQYKINLFVPDLHSFTTPIEHENLQAQIMQNLRIFAAAGLPLDNPDVNIYRQSRIPAHSELTWILSCFTGLGEMSRMTQFKDKSTSLKDDRTSVGLFSYPILMAADILLYDALYVPVGDDQTQHLEFTRDIAERMNARFNTDLFTIPLPVSKQHAFFNKDQGLRIRDLSDPSKKMSKSDETGKGVLFLSESIKSASKKIMSATTDDKNVIKYNPSSQPGISNLLVIYSLLKGTSVKEIEQKYDGVSSYGTFKQDVAEEMTSFLSRFQEAYSKISETAVLAKLEESEKNMNILANKTLLNVQRAVGLR